MKPIVLGNHKLYTKIKECKNSETITGKNGCILLGNYEMKASGLASTASGSGRNPDFDTSFHTSNDDNEVAVHAIKDRKSPLLPSKEQDIPDNSLRYNWHFKYKITRNQDLWSCF